MPWVPLTKIETQVPRLVKIHHHAAGLVAVLFNTIDLLRLTTFRHTDEHKVPYPDEYINVRDLTTFDATNNQLSKCSYQLRQTIAQT